MLRFLICLLLMASSSPAADLSGVWDLEMEWSGGSQSTGVCKLKQDEAKLSGTCAEKSSVTGQVHDRRVTWEVEVQQDGQAGRMTFEGTLNDAGTTVQGTCAVLGGPSGKFTMRKQK